MRTNKDKHIMKHILNYCDQVADAVERIETLDNLLEDSFYQNALAMPIAQIGELARILSDEYKGKTPDIPWNEIRSMRNHLIHSYGEIDWEKVWYTATQDVPELKEKCLAIKPDVGIPL
ncbi:DUF86 domain-containing protein [Anaerovibrio sp.]|uniref:HepT-like ribonuclease domain-containing protein n=1 Tax=Anaerovibrio sp. TaxID=1872532 RepID=UPI00388F6F6C